MPLLGVALLETGMLVALAQRDREQRAVGLERPGVIRAAEELPGIAAGIDGDARALVRAAIVEDVDLAVGVAHHQHRLLADRRAISNRRDWAPGCRGRHRSRCWRTGAPSPGRRFPGRYRRRGGLRSRAPESEPLLRCRDTGPWSSPIADLFAPEHDLCQKSSFAALQIDHQPRRLRARHANLHHLVSGALVIAEDVVAMVGHALQHGDLADAALAALAIVQRIDRPPRSAPAGCSCRAAR